MKTVGLILKEARLAKGCSLEQAEADTKIRANFLDALERDDYNQLPSPLYAKGFVKNYSEYLGLNSATVLAFFRRQNEDIPKTSIFPKGVAEPLNKSGMRLTPGRFLALTILGCVALFLFYLGFQYRRLSEPPRLVIESPKDKAVTIDRKIDVMGKTDPDATVFINGVSLIVQSDGRFFDQITLEPGVNQLTISATSRYGKSTIVKREVVQQTQ